MDEPPSFACGTEKVFLCFHDVVAFPMSLLFGDYLYAQNVSCSQIWEAERFNWAATRGVNEEMLMETLPEDLQRDIRRHLFKFVKKVSLVQKLIQLKEILVFVKF